jgi:hypothetical protein
MAKYKIVEVFEKGDHYWEARDENDRWVVGTISMDSDETCERKLRSVISVGNQEIVVKEIEL